MDREEQMRRRKAYRQFMSFYKGIAHWCSDDIEDIKTIMLIAFKLLDDNGVFKSRNSRNYAMESMELVVKDLELSE